MGVLIVFGIVMVAGFSLGFVISDALTEHRFWSRQNYMNKLNNKF